MCFKLQLAPSLRKVATHAHGMDYFGISLSCPVERVATPARFSSFHHRFVAARIVDQRQNSQDDRSGHSKMAEIGMENIKDGDVDRYPWRIEKRKQGTSGNEIPEAVHIFDRIVARRLAAVNFPLHCRVQNRHADFQFESGPQTVQHPLTNPVEQTYYDKNTAEQQGKGDQRVHILAGEHPVIDLQHVEGCSKCKNIESHAECGNGPKTRTQRRPGIADGRDLTEHFLLHFLSSGRSTFRESSRVAEANTATPGNRLRRGSRLRPVATRRC